MYSLGKKCLEAYPSRVVFGRTYQQSEVRGQGSPMTTPLDIAGIICLTLDRVVMLSQVEEVQEDSVWNVSEERYMELILVNIRRITSCLIMLLDRHPQRSQTSQNSHHLGFKKS
jgi:hypothetical protein